MEAKTYVYYDERGRKDCDTFTKVIVGNVSAEEKKELLECLR